jgi:hypothetical protein
MRAPATLSAQINFRQGMVSSPESILDRSNEANAAATV